MQLSSPLRGFYQVKEVSPTELRLLLLVEFDPELIPKCPLLTCQIRIPFHHRGPIRANNLRNKFSI